MKRFSGELLPQYARRELSGAQEKPATPPGLRDWRRDLDVAGAVGIAAEEAVGFDAEEKCGVGQPGAIWCPGEAGGVPSCRHVDRRPSGRRRDVEFAAAGGILFCDGLSIIFL